VVEEGPLRPHQAPRLGAEVATAQQHAAALEGGVQVAGLGVHVAARQLDPGDQVGVDRPGQRLVEQPADPVEVAGVQSFDCALVQLDGPGHRSIMA
jgi:hypothetical protein